MRSGPLVEGEWVRLTDPKGRKHNLKLEVGAQFSTKKGQLNHDDMIGHPEGIVIESSMGATYQVFRPLLFEYVVSMPRGAAIIYPKDAAQIITMADIYPGARVVEAGAGLGQPDVLPAARDRPRGNAGLVRDPRGVRRERTAQRRAGRRHRHARLDADRRRRQGSDHRDRDRPADPRHGRPVELHPAGRRATRARRHRLRVRRHDDAAVAVRREHPRGRRVHRAARVGDACSATGTSRASRCVPTTR